MCVKGGETVCLEMGYMGVRERAKVGERTCRDEKIPHSYSHYRQRDFYSISERR